MKKSVFLPFIILSIILLYSCKKESIDLSTPPLLNQGANPTEKHKRIAVMAMIANVNFGLVTSTESQLVANTRRIGEAFNNNTDLKNYIGNDWKVVWGPVIATSPKSTDSFTTDNTMYIAQGKDMETGKSLYVVAIAGTNIVSKKGWTQEDFNVLSKQDWGKPNSGKISKGTSVGLDILLNMKDLSSNKTALQFFEDLNKDSTYEIACTGHSLGGALSPVMALKIIEWKEKNQLNNITISIYPIAGATPGDKEFASYAASKFVNNYFSVINSNDIVPNSWENDMYAKIPNLYNNANFNSGAGFTFPQELKTTYDAMKIGISNKQYTRIAASKEFVFSGIPNVYSATTPGTFFTEAAYQHTQGYFKNAFNFPPQVIEAISSIMHN